MDIALAHVAGLRLKESGQHWTLGKQGNWYRCRDAKELLLSDPALASCTVSVLGRGSSLVGGTISTEVTGGYRQRDSQGIPSVLCARRGTPGASSSGLRQRGLPYAQDPAITRHLAGFVSQNNGPEKPHQTICCSMGGVQSSTLKNRVQHVMGAWGM